jgi:hypothetical protein
MLLVLAALAAILLVLALVFRLPQKLGLAPDPGAAMFANGPDRGTGTMAVDELAAAGYPITGLRIYLYPNPDGGQIAYAVLDGSKGFEFSSDTAGDPALDFFVRLSSLQTLTDSDIRLLAFAYRDQQGKVVTIMSTTVDDTRAYGMGVMDETTFVHTIQGWVDPVFLLSTSPTEEGGS